MDLSNLSDNELELLTFIVVEYKTGTFNTSLTTGSLFETKEEKLLDACIEDGEDWMATIPNLLAHITITANIGLDSTEFKAVRRFLLDSMDDLFICNVREA